MDWYERNIESGIREIVRLLRDNGVNTTYSCHHAMVVEAEAYTDTDIGQVYDLLVEHGYDDFTIELTYNKSAGQSLVRCLAVRFHQGAVRDCDTGRQERDRRKGGVGDDRGDGVGLGDLRGEMCQP